MTMSSGRVLKSNQLDDHEIVVLHDQQESSSVDEPKSAVPVTAPTTEVDEALLFTASEVEDLCAKARASGAADAAASLEPALAQVAAAMETFVHQQHAAQDESRRAQTREIVDTSMSVAKWVLGRELGDPAVLLELVDRALGDRSSDATSTVRVHPDLVPLLFEIAPDHLDVRGDRGLQLGEFLVDSGGPDIAFRFDTALDRASAALEQPAATPESGSDL